MPVKSSSSPLEGNPASPQAPWVAAARAMLLGLATVGLLSAVGYSALAEAQLGGQQRVPRRAGPASPSAAPVVPAATAEPRYVVEPCCQLCPAASNRGLYTTSYLQGFTTLVQGKDGWLFRSDDDLRTQFGPDTAGYEGLRDFRDALKRHGTELVLVYQPARGLLHSDKLPPDLQRSFNLPAARSSYASALEQFRRTGMVVPRLETLLTNPGPTPYFFRGDHHWTPEGSRRTAQLVADAVKTMPVYRQLPKKQFVTTRIGVLAKRGTMQKAATTLCGHGYPDQYVDRYATGAAEGGDLFGEDDVPQVALVGTSNSDSAYNFSGFLSEALGVEVLNESITGGGFDGPLYRYLPSPAFQKTPPKVLIWELETYHNLAEREFYRRVMPLVNDGCRQKTPVLSKTVRLTGGSTEVLFNGGGGKVREMPGRNYLLDIQFDDPTVGKLKAIVWYGDGGKDTISLENSPRFELNGRFVVDLRRDNGYGNRSFLSLDIMKPDTTPAGVGVKAQICSREDGGPANRRVAAVDARAVR